MLWDSGSYLNLLFWVYTSRWGIGSANLFPAGKVEAQVFHWASTGGAAFLLLLGVWGTVLAPR